MAKLPPGIELRHLRYFMAACECGSFRKASTALGIQESAISRRIRDLEDRVGASLFLRHNGGVSLTLAGQRLLDRTRKAFDHLGYAARDVAALGRSEDGYVRVGIFSSLASGILADLLRTYDAHHAAVRIDFVAGDPADHVAAIRQFHLDVAFVTGTRTWPDCEAATLWSERVFAVLPDSHRLAVQDKVAWHDLDEETFIVSQVALGAEIHDYLVQKLADFSHPPNIHYQNVGRDNLLPLVALGRGLTLTSEATTAAVFPGVVYRPVIGETLPFSAVWSPRNDNPAFRRLLSLAKTLSRRGSRCQHS